MSEDWKTEGLCAEVGGELFFPEKGDLRSARAAKSVCRRCAVIDECREYAMDAHEPYGVWGGMSERDRRLLRAARNREAGVTRPQSANLKGVA